MNKNILLNFLDSVRCFIWSFGSIFPYKKKKSITHQKELDQIPLFHLLLVKKISIKTKNNNYS